jgi:CheY-like chemotaxis protein
MKILVVVDHWDTARAISRMLRLEGYLVGVAPSCRQALRAFEDTRFDLIILDISLPDGDGCELLGELNQIYPVKSIAITGHEFWRNSNRIQRAGFDKFLLKPVGAGQFYQAIAQLFADPQCLRLN